ncbi:MAG TPA: VOC family protein [Dehalococcoidia bacterium]|jgi:PhnB protein
MNTTDTQTGVRRVTAYLCAKGAAEAVAFYARAFGATEGYRFTMPDGRIGYTELTIGGSTLMLSDEAPELGVLSPRSLGGNSTSFVVEVEDADAAFQRALDAGATVERPLKDEPYGRAGWVVDPFGHRWSIMTPTPDFDPAQMQP